MVDLNTIQQEFLEWYQVEGTFEINTQRQVWIKGSVILKWLRPDLGFDFQEVTHSIYLSRKELKSLQGLPDQVGGDLEISGNPLVDLKHCSLHVGGSLWIDKMEDHLKSLEGFPPHVSKAVYVTYDPDLPMLRTLNAQEVSVNKTDYVNSEIFNKIQKLNQILNDPQWQGKGKSGMLNCALALKKAGLQGNAKW